MTRKQRRKQARLGRARQAGALTASERFLARVFERLLQEPAFAAYLRSHWAITPAIDHARRHLDVEVHPLGPSEEDVDGSPQPA